MSDRERIEALIEASSLGTDEAKAARASVSDETAARIMARVRELDEGRGRPMTAPMIASRTRADILAEIHDLRAEANRLPMLHQRREKIEARIDVLTDCWLEARG